MKANREIYRVDMLATDWLANIIPTRESLFVEEMVEMFGPFIEHFGNKGTLYADVVLTKDLVSFIYSFKCTFTKAMEYQKFFESTNLRLCSDFPKGFEYSFEDVCKFAEFYPLAYNITKYPFTIMSHCSVRENDGIFIIDTILKVPTDKLVNHEGRPG